MAGTIQRFDDLTFGRPAQAFLDSPFFQFRLGAFVTSPFLMALAATRTYRTSPFGISALTRWRFGRNRRLVMAVTCVPMPPCFLGLPLRQMMLPFIGPLPVNSQIRSINSFVFV